MSRRRALRYALLTGGTVASGVLVLACGGSPAAAPTAGSASAAATPIPASQPATATPVPASQPAAATAAPASSVSSSAPAPGAATPGAPDESGAPKPDLVAKPPKSAQPITLRFHMRTGGEKSEPAIYAFRPQEWMDQTGIKIQLEPIPGDSNYFPKLEALAAGGTIGDLTWTSDVASQHSHLVHFNVLEPVDSYLQTYKLNKDDWFSSITDSLTYNGKMYGMPKTGHPGDAYIWINLDMFKAAGIPEPPEYGVTFDNIREWANKLSKGPKDSREVYGFYSGVVGLQPLTNGIRQFGGDIVAADGVTSLIDKPEFADWLNWEYQLIVQDRVHPFSQAIPNGDIVALFAAQKVAMVHSQRYFQFGARNAVKDKFKWKSIQFPRGPKAKGWGTSIDTHAGTAASKYKDEAFTLTAAISDKRFAFLVGKFQGYLTGRKDNLDDLGPYAGDYFIQLQQKCTEQNDPFWRAKNLRATEIETALNNSFDQVWLGQSQPNQDYISGLKKTIDDILAKPL
jgi:ABC-type glycerol-3-phosphate transport system substrate-binding protein